MEEGIYKTIKQRWPNIWKDPVWSKVISAVILAIISYVLLLIKSAADKVPLGYVLLEVLTYRIEIWQALIAFIIYTAWQAYQQVRLEKRRNEQEKYKAKSKNDLPTASIKFIKPISKSINSNKINYKIKIIEPPVVGNTLHLCVEIEQEAWMKDELKFDAQGISEGSITEWAQVFLLSVIELTPEGQEIVKKWFQESEKNNFQYKPFREIPGTRVDSLVLKKN